MKTIVAAGNRLDCKCRENAWYFLADSALANAGKPFFIPDFAESFDAFISPVVKISKLGKSIAAKFAPRYYSEIAPAIHFSASALRERLLSKGLPPDMAQSFDRSMIIGKFMPADVFEESLPIGLLKNGVASAEWHPDMFHAGIDKIIETVSSTNTMKTGDLVAPGLSVPVKISPGDRLELISGRNVLLLVAIK